MSSGGEKEGLQVRVSGWDLLEVIQHPIFSQIILTPTVFLPTANHLLLGGESWFVTDCAFLEKTWEAVSEQEVLLYDNKKEFANWW